MSARWEKKFDALAALLRLKDEETKRPTALRPFGMLFDASNAAQSEFLKIVFHELRTPLSLIIGHTGLLQDGLLGEVSEEQKKSLAQILKSSNELLALVVSILQAGIEVDSVELKSKAVPLGCLLSELKAETDTPNEKAIDLV